MNFRVGTNLTATLGFHGSTAKNIFGGFRKPMKMAIEIRNPEMAVELVRTVYPIY